MANIPHNSETVEMTKLVIIWCRYLAVQALQRSVYRSTQLTLNKQQVRYAESTFSSIGSMYNSVQVCTHYA